MLICPDCGTRNAAGTRFCADCGSYLGWGDAPAPGPVGTDPVPVPRPRPAPDPSPRHEPRRHPHDRLPPEGPPPGPQEGSGGKVPQHNRGKVSKLPPVADDRTVVLPRVPDQGSPPRDGRRSGDPPPVPPEESRPRPPRPPDEEPEAPPAPGEVACPGCGAGNSPDRHFCRRCALELAPALAPPPPRPAGRTRPHRKGLSPPAWALIVLLVLLALVLARLIGDAARAQDVLGHGPPATRTPYEASALLDAGPGSDAQ